MGDNIKAFKEWLEQKVKSADGIDAAPMQSVLDEFNRCTQRICKICGNPEEGHNFRHQFQEIPRNPTYRDVVEMAERIRALKRFNQ